MKLARRSFLSCLGASCLPIITAAQAEEEPFHISIYEESKVEYKYRKREVKFETTEPPGTIVVDLRKKFLYFVLADGKAMRYGVGIASQYTRWSGTVTIYRMAKWPTWTPTPEMLARHKNYDKWRDGMPGGLDNPLGARALYLKDENGVDHQYRIHGTPLPETIGQPTTQGCFRMLNADVVDLANRVKIGTRVVVLPLDKRGGLFSSN